MKHQFDSGWERYNAIINSMKKKITSAHTAGVLLEHIDSKLDLLIEGNATLDKKINDVHTGLHQELTELKKETNYKFDIVIEELHIIRNELKEKVGRDEFILLEKRVARLEKTGR